ncbi:Hypothetical predicted protein [Olea europaea subsp. europaea]|uniref:Protein BIG GRAIN 1-like A n=1 Tax=Olea europaea subsp. europaea TaxID=158383 RepID=A0A8S0QTA0_OLEEU|nr:Hypothetical predicted protein [Olea europaea subsp. europaea]
MYSWEKQFRENPKMPTFSSTLLDEIYRSIDQKSEDLKIYKEKSMRKQGGGRPKVTAKDVEDEEMARFWRACLVEKWMEKEINEKVVAKKRSFLLPELEKKSNHETDVSFFSSSSSSSDSSGVLSSSSDTEFFGGSVSKSRVSCFSATRLKPVRTSVSPRENPLFHEQNEHDLPHEYRNHQADRIGENLINSKSRALKIYASLKKAKQPISPGGRLTNFINSLFANANTKKAVKNPNTKNIVFEDSGMERKSKSTQDSPTYSSASSFSRSCLSKNSPKSREKMRNGIKRTVRFHPVSVIVDEDCRRCGQRSIYDEDSDKFGRPPLPLNTVVADLRVSLREKNRKAEEAARDFSAFKNILDNLGNEDEEEDDEDDAASDSSSDLFELDHLALFGNNRFCEELPVYETTHLHTNHAITSGLIS